MPHSTLADLAKSIAGLEKHLAADATGLAERARLADLDAQCTAAHGAANAARDAYADAVTAATLKTTERQPYDRAGLDRARGAVAAAIDHRQILTEARARQLERVGTLAAERAADAAARVQPVLADALTYLGSQVEAVTAADALVERLHVLAQHACGTNRLDLQGGYRFSAPDRAAHWRRRVADLFSFASS